MVCPCDPASPSVRPLVSTADIEAAEKAPGRVLYQTGTTTPFALPWGYRCNWPPQRRGGEREERASARASAGGCTGTVQSDDHDGAASDSGQAVEHRDEKGGRKRTCKMGGSEVLPRSIRTLKPGWPCCLHGLSDKDSRSDVGGPYRKEGGALSSVRVTRVPLPYTLPHCFCGPCQV